MKIRKQQVTRTQLDAAILAQAADYSLKGASAAVMMTAVAFAEAVNTRLFGNRPDGPCEVRAKILEYQYQAEQEMKRTQAKDEGDKRASGIVIA